MKLYRCKHCRTTVRSLPNFQFASKMTEIRDASCCDHPKYVEIKPMHYIHLKGKGILYSQGVIRNKELGIAESVVPEAMYLACSTTRKEEPNLAAVTMTAAVTCPDCIEFIKAQRIKVPEESHVPENIEIIDNALKQVSA